MRKREEKGIGKREVRVDEKGREKDGGEGGEERGITVGVECGDEWDEV